MKKIIHFMGVLLIFMLTSSVCYPKDLTASIALLPGLSNSNGKGPWIDLVKAIDKVYDEGTIKIKTYPMARSIDNVIKGKADFHIPMFRNPIVPESQLPFNFSTEDLGVVTFVIYANKDNPISANSIKQALDKEGEFPYKIKSGNGFESFFRIPILKTNNIESALKMVDEKRIDGLLWAQEEADVELKRLKLKNIKRFFWKNFNDIVVIPKGKRGEEIDKILSAAIRKLNETGELKKLRKKIHVPYVDWQPSEMGW